MRTVMPQLRGIALARDPDYQPEVATTPGLDASDSILDDHRAWRRHPEPLRRHEEGIRGRLAGQVVCLDRGPIDADVEAGCQLDGL
jgi:hypothetical protein